MAAISPARRPSALLLTVAGVIGTFAAFGARSEMCAKAQSQSGTIKAGSGCNYNALGRVSCLTNTEPISAGYGYWAGSGSVVPLAGQIASPSDSPDC